MRNPLRLPSADQTQRTAELLSPISMATDAHGIRDHVLNILFIVGLVVILFWRVFLLGETLIDQSTLNNQLPWGYSAGEHSNYPYDRRDPTDMYVTRDYFVVQSYRDGELPLWNPFTMAGHPIYADGVTRIFSPSLLLYAFLDVPLGYTVARVLELGLGSIFLYLFLIGIGARAKGALVGALVFAFSSHSMLHLIGLGWWGGLMWLPLIFLFADRALRRSSYACATLAGIILAIQVYSGYTANEIYYLGAIILYYVFFALLARSRTERSWLAAKPLGAIGMMAVTMAVGLSVSLPVWVPVLEQLKYSNRLIVPTQIGYIYLPPCYLGTLVFPSIFGAPYDAGFLTLFQAIGVSHDHTLYMGIAALGMFGFCLFWVRRQYAMSGLEDPAGSGSASKRSRMALLLNAGRGLSFGLDRLLFFVALAALALLIITTAPIYVHVTRFLPVLQTIRVIMRAGVLLVFAASVLAGFGCQLLLESPREIFLEYYRFAKKCLFLLIVIVAAGVAGAYAIKAAGLQTPQEGKGKVAFIRKALGLMSMQLTPPNLGIVIPVVLALGLVILLYLGGAGRISRRTLYGALVGLLVIDLFWNSRNFESSYDGSRVYPHTQITDRLAGLPPSRVLPTPSDLGMNRRIDAIAARPKIIAPPNTLLPYRLPTVTGKDQVFPKWYHDFATLIEPQPEMSHVVFDRSQSPFFDLLNTRYVLTHDSDSPPTGMELIETAEGVALYRNPAALGRAFFAPRVEVVRNEEEAMSMMRGPEFDPAKTIVLEDPDGSPGLALRPMAQGVAAAGQPEHIDDPEPIGTANLIEDRRNTVKISTESQTAGILFLSDTYYPGWAADIDGAPLRIYKADVAFRAVQVPPGRHIITYVFAPRSFRLSLYGGGAGVLAALAGLMFGRARRRDPEP